MPQGFLSFQILNKGFMGTYPSLGDQLECTVYPKKYAHGFVVFCFVVVTQSFIMNSYEVFIHIHQGCFAGTGAIVRLPQCQWSKPDGYGKISQCITTTKHSKAKTVCIFLGIYCSTDHYPNLNQIYKGSSTKVGCYLMKTQILCDIPNHTVNNGKKNSHSYQIWSIYWDEVWKSK